MPDEGALIGHRTVTPDAVARFGALTGDYSRIHFDHELGLASGLGGGFAHGLLGASWALGMMSLHQPDRLGCGDPGAFVSGLEVRFQEVVRFGDTVALRLREKDSEAAPSGWQARRSGFELVNQHGRTATRGAVDLLVRSPGAAGGWAEPRGPAPEPWPASSPEPQPGCAPLLADDMLEHGPRGAARIRTVTEADVVAFAGFTGELNPLSLDTVFASGALFGERTAPPMLCFCLGFAAWLRQLLALPLGGSESSAGHLGDRWRFVAPVAIGDTLEVRYRPLSVRRTRSQPVRGIATFGLQLLNQREQVVQEGEVDMMMALRDPEGSRD